jgi:hypothetical protein
VAARHRSIRCSDADERCFADGEAVWSWRPDAGVKLAKTRPASRERWWQESPVTRESPE